MNCDLCGHPVTVVGDHDEGTLSYRPDCEATRLREVLGRLLVALDTLDLRDPLVLEEAIAAARALYNDDLPTPTGEVPTTLVLDYLQVVNGQVDGRLFCFCQRPVLITALATPFACDSCGVRYSLAGEPGAYTLYYEEEVSATGDRVYHGLDQLLTFERKSSQ